MLNMKSVSRQEVADLLQAGLIGRLDLDGASLLQLPDGRILIDTDRGPCGLIGLPSKLERTGDSPFGFPRGQQTTP